jgi:hypothetical protein
MRGFHSPCQLTRAELTAIATRLARFQHDKTGAAIVQKIREGLAPATPTSETSTEIPNDP